MMLPRAGKWLLGAAMLATLAFPLLVGGISSLGGLKEVTATGYFSILVMIVLGWYAHALKLRALLRHLGIDLAALQTLRVSLAADLGFLITPGGVGGYATSVYYLRRVGASMSGAIAVTSADQALDAIFFVVAIPLAAMFVSTTQIPHPSLSMVVLFLGACGFIVAVAWAWGKYGRDRNRQRPFTPTQQRWRQRLYDFAHRLITDMRKLLAEDPLLFFRVSMLTAVQQLSRYGALWLIFLLLGYPLPFSRVLLGQTLVVQAAALTGIPAGGGVAELGLTTAFGDVLPPTAMATALLLWRGATLYLGLIAGVGAIMSFAFEARKARRFGCTPKT